MKLTVTQENLNRALSTVGRVASSKTSLPVLNNILLRTDKNRLLLAATNLEIAITEYIGASIQSDGAITIPARLISDYVSNLPKGNVSLELEGTKLHINTDTYHSTINGVVADEFPELPEITEPSTYVIPAQVVKRSIAQTVLTASHDDTRPVLTGAYVHIHEGKLYFAATDGYRLAERQVMPVEGELAAIIPASALQDVVRVLPDDCDEVTMLIDGMQVRFLMNDIEITSRLIEGNFPNYRQLIPKETDVQFTVPKDEFNRITKIASLFARESGGSITVKTDVQKGVVSIHSVASQLGENTSEIATVPTGDGQVTLNSRYLIEALGTVDGQVVSFGFSGKLAPCVLKAEGDETYQHIIMPLKS